MKKEVKFSLVYRDMWQSSGKYVPRKDQLEKIAPLIIYKFDRKQVEFGFGSSFNHMHMHGCMVIGVKQESVTKQNKYRWHSFYFSAKIGNNFITRNTFCFFKAIKQKKGAPTGTPFLD